MRYRAIIPSLLCLIASGAAAAAAEGSNPILPQDKAADSGLSPVAAQRAIEAPDIRGGASWQEVGAYFTAVGDSASIAAQSEAGQRLFESGGNFAALSIDDLRALTAIAQPSSIRDGARAEIERRYVAYREVGGAYLVGVGVVPNDQVGAALREKFDTIDARSARDPVGCLGYAPTLEGYDAANRQASDDAQRRMDVAWQGTGASSVSNGLNAAAEREDAMRRLMAPRVAIESAGLVSANWQGTSALVDLTDGITPRGLRSDGLRLAAGLAVERLALDGEPVTGAVEALVRVSLPVGITEGWAVGPAITARAGASGDGLVLGWDATIHLDHAIGHGIGVVVDVGAGQRAQHSSATSDVEPQVGAGIICVF